MPTQNDDDRNVGQQHADDLFEGRTGGEQSGSDAAARQQRALDSMSEPQRARTLRRLEQQAASRDNAKTEGTAADDARDREARGGWLTNVRGARDNAKKKVNFAKKRAKRWIMGLVIVSVFSVVGTILGVLPHKLDMLAKQMESKFYSRIEQYVEKRSHILLFRYLAIYVFGNTGAIKSCIDKNTPNFTVHSDCFYRENRDDWPKTKLGQMYKGWKEARIEARLLSHVNIHYAPNGLLPNGNRGPTWVITLPSGDQVPIDPRNPDSGMTQAFTTIDQTDSSRRAKTEMYNKIMASLKHETKSNLIIRMMASIHLKRKYGLTRCIFYCDLRDRIDERKHNIRTAWHGFLAQRVFGSINARAGIFIGCMFQGSGGCSEENSEYRQKYQETIDKLKLQFGNDKIENVIKLAEEYGKFRAEGGNLTKFIMSKIMEKIASKISVAGGASFINAIPIIGQILYGIIVGYQALAVILILYNMYTFVNSDQAQFASTVIKSGAFTAAAQTMNTVNDESRAADGTVFSAAVRGVQSDSVSPEKSLIWNAAYIDPKAIQNFGALFAKAAYAAEPAKEYPIVCDDEGTLLEKDQVVCPSWRFDYPNPVRQLAKSLPGSTVAEAIANSESGQAVQEFATDVTETIDAPFAAATAFAYENLAPGAVKKWLEDNMRPFVQKLTNYIFGVPIKSIEDLLGPKLYDAWHLGTDWTINDLLRGGLENDGKQYGLGARVATDKEVIALEEDYRREQREAYAKLNFYEKIFSTEHESTVVNQLAMAMPGNFTQALQVVSPSTAFNLIHTATRGDTAMAAVSPMAYHGGIPQYVFSNQTVENAPMRAIDDETPCPVDRADSDGELKRAGDSGTTSKGLGRAEFTTENTCLLDDFVIEVNSSNQNKVPLDPDIANASATSTTEPGDGVATGQFVWPIAESDFKGTTSCYRGPGRPDHYGLDMQGKKGAGKTEILAADGGKVITVAFEAGGAGHYVTIKHANNLSTMYMHMPSKAAIRVREGQNVTKGQVIGLEGASGQVTGPHLHFTIGKGNSPNNNSDSINPLKYLKDAMPAGSSYAKNNGCPIP